MIPLLFSHTIIAVLYLIVSAAVVLQLVPTQPNLPTNVIISGSYDVKTDDSFISGEAVASAQQAASDQSIVPDGTGAIATADLNADESSEQNQPQDSSQTPNLTHYPWHDRIQATVFWAGEDATSDNGYITNTESAWTSRWTEAFGGIDDPACRSGYNPCGFTPLENPFYFALPFGDYTETGLKSNLSAVYWYAGPVAIGQSILKNRWIQVNANGKTVYAQWEDVGPYKSDDYDYVFGAAEPQYAKAGIDLSPAADNFLGLHGSGTVSWRFVELADVPAGPWRSIVTTSAPHWQ